MWIYQKTLQHPVNIKNGDLKMAKNLITQFGGPNGELAAAVRYLSQRYTMPTGKSKALLTDIGTEELAHVEMIATMVNQLTCDASVEELKKLGLVQIMPKMVLEYFHLMQTESHLVQHLLQLWEILLQTFTKIWQQSKKLLQLIII